MLRIVANTISILLGIYLYFMAWPMTLPEITKSTGTRQQQANKNYFTLLAGILFWLLMIVLLAGESVLYDHGSDIIRSFNQTLYLDALFCQKLLPPRHTIKKTYKVEESLCKIACYLTLAIPIAFAVSLFHPADPLHNIIEDVFEIPVKISPFFLCVLVPLEIWGVYALTLVATIFILLGLIQVFVIKFWLSVALPLQTKDDIFLSRQRNVQLLRTVDLGHVREDVAIWLYRSLQVLTALSNKAMSTNRMVYHANGVMMCAVVSAFASIKFRKELLAQSSANTVGLLLILNIGFTLMIFVYFCECNLLQEVEWRWILFKSRLLSKSKRKSVLHKAARSFRAVTLNLGGNFFNVNKSTFLDWCMALQNHLVTLLVSD